MPVAPAIVLPTHLFCHEYEPGQQIQRLPPDARRHLL